MSLIPFIKRGTGNATSRPAPPVGSAATAQRTDTPPPVHVRALRLAHTEQPSERERREHRRVRAELYPAGSVVALPRRAPINDDDPGTGTPEAA